MSFAAPETTPAPFTRLSPTAQLVVKAIESGHVDAAAIARSLDLRPGTIRKQLHELQKKFVTTRVARGRYRVLPIGQWQVR